MVAYIKNEYLELASVQGRLVYGMKILPLPPLPPDLVKDSNRTNSISARESQPSLVLFEREKHCFLLMVVGVDFLSMPSLSHLSPL